MNILTTLKNILLFPIRWSKPQGRYTKEEALQIGKHFGMEDDVRMALNYGYTPDEALLDWDIYPYTEEQYNEWIK